MKKLPLAITSRPLLLSSIGRLTESGRQKKMIITSTHGDIKKLGSIYKRLVLFFNKLKAIVLQLTLQECWECILGKAMEVFNWPLTNMTLAENRQINCQPLHRIKLNYLHELFKHTNFFNCQFRYFRVFSDKLPS